MTTGRHRLQVRRGMDRAAGVGAGIALPTP
jgi:hypothetical protein